MECNRVDAINPTIFLELKLAKNVILSKAQNLLMLILFMILNFLFHFNYQEILHPLKRDSE